MTSELPTSEREPIGSIILQTSSTEYDSELVRYVNLSSAQENTLRVKHTVHKAGCAITVMLRQLYNTVHTGPKRKRQTNKVMEDGTIITQMAVWEKLGQECVSTGSVYLSHHPNTL